MTEKPKRRGRKKSIKAILPIVPESMNVMQRKYKNPFKRNKYYKQFYELILFTVGSMRPSVPFEKCYVEICVRLPKNRFRDYDNLVASLKPVVDGLVKAGIMKDDNYNVTGPWNVYQIEDYDKEGEALIIQVIEE